MAQMPIQASIKPRMSGHEKQKPSTRFQKVVDVSQRRFILFNMLQYVETDDRVNMKRSVPFYVCARDAKAFDHEFLILPEGILQKGEEFRLHIGRDDQISIQKKFGNVSDPGTDFQNPSSQKGLKN